MSIMNIIIKKEKDNQRNLNEGFGYQQIKI
jgi:hypothetical protein